MEINNNQIQAMQQVANVTANEKFLEMMAKAQQNKQKVSAQIGKQQYVPKVSEGQFVAVTTDAKLEQNLPTKYGLNDCIKVTYSILVPNETNPVDIVMTYWKTASITSLYVKQLSVLLGADARDGFAVSNLIGKQCLVSIKHNHMNDGRIFANVDELTLLNLQNNMSPIEF
ncbi:hypothetical protein [Metalysinibacillus jejuensis]|uniref:hypothetical protein n=1 Tax=Metalysinibacillus jejuensis TaxID=914327 RepID=UPI000D34A2D8|nr:hypothetical protein [Metalysinibacillus jejuensis]